jgi:nucleotide-binding universal stress UspA family protein
MIRTILAPMAGGGSKPALTASLAVARLFNGHIECLHTRPDVAEIVARTSSYYMGTPVIVSNLYEAFQKEDEGLAKRARAMFEQWRKDADIPESDTPPGAHGVTCHWAETVGDVQRRVVARARFHDLTVVDNGRAHSSPELTSALLSGSGRPLLLAPETMPEQLLDTVAIAWKETAEAARAVTAAMPLLAKARRIVVVAADEEGRKSLDCVECTDKLVRQFEWHGFNVEGRFVLPGGRSVAKTIIDTAHEVKAGLVVMGGYSHSRAREFIFGGVTQEVLNGVKLPVLMAH